VWPRARRDDPGRPKTGRPARELAFCKRNPRLTGYYAAPLITIAQEMCFILRTLEHVTFAMGQSPAYPRAMVRHTGGNSGYIGRARPAVTGIKGRPPSMLNPQAWMAVGNLAACCWERQRRACSDEPTHSRKGRGGGEASVAHRGACSNDG